MSPTSQTLKDQTASPAGKATLIKAGDQILRAARLHGAPLDETPILAEAVSHVTTPADIPDPLVAALAQILAFVATPEGPP